MFKVGDVVIYRVIGTDLTYLKSYKVVSSSYEKICIINDLNKYKLYDNWQFISKIDLRKQKLDKICSKLEI